jgi:hypothetical protein
VRWTGRVKGFEATVGVGTGMATPHGWGRIVGFEVFIFIPG